MCLSACAVRRPSDPPDRQAAYGVLPAGAVHAPAQSLPHLRRWGRWVLQTVQRSDATLPRLRLAVAGYVRAGTDRPQAWHRDVPLAHAGVALSAFSPVNVASPDDDPAGSRWRPEGRRAQPMGNAVGDLFVIDSRTQHRGGACPRGIRHRYVAFAALVEAGRPPPDYDSTVPL